ncbi:unnamed protein product [Staurois parvus]|uniref:Uncharacterized protein n=1 Tax=Staurois parvus TaxID=386267 RepID=A0ABN9G9C8_9NEOB|nr:unnamed protein product [Staurois parvus]
MLLTYCGNVSRNSVSIFYNKNYSITLWEVFVCVSEHRLVVYYHH